MSLHAQLGGDDMPIAPHIRDIPSADIGWIGDYQVIPPQREIIISHEQKVSLEKREVAVGREGLLTERNHAWVNVYPGHMNS